MTPDYCLFKTLQQNYTQSLKQQWLKHYAGLALIGFLASRIGYRHDLLTIMPNILLNAFFSGLGFWLLVSCVLSTIFGNQYPAIFPTIKPLAERQRRRKQLLFWCKSLMMICPGVTALGILISAFDHSSTGMANVFIISDLLTIILLLGTGYSLTRYYPKQTSSKGKAWQKQYVFAPYRCAPGYFGGTYKAINRGSRNNFCVVRKESLIPYWYEQVPNQHSPTPHHEEHCY